jgi:pimeloyl-ACP methyl ester carboxylesterase
MAPAQVHSAPTTALAAAMGLIVLGGGLALLNKKRAREAKDRSPANGRFIEVGGTHLHYLDRGAGPPVVLLHGNGAMAADFEASGLIDRLATSHRVLAFDRPGFGYSARPRGRAWTAQRQARLIHEALEALEIERPIVVGHSWGTLVALNLAMDHSGSIAALVLVSGYYFPSARTDVVMAMPQALPVLGDVLSHTIAPLLGKVAAPRIIRKVFAPSDVPARFNAGFPLDLALRPTQLHATAGDTSHMIPAARATMPRRQALTMPIAILAGARDEIVNTAAQSGRLAQELGHAALTLVPGAGHMLHYDAPGQITDAIDRVAAMAGWDMSTAKEAISSQPARRPNPAMNELLLETPRPEPKAWP